MEKEIEITVEAEGREAEPRDIWEAQPLSPGNTARLIRLLAAQLARKLILGRSDLVGATDEEVLLALLEILDERSLIEFLSIAVDQPPEVVKANFDVTKAIPSLIGFFKIHNFGILWGEARRAAGMGQVRKKGKKRRSRSKK